MRQKTAFEWVAPAKAACKWFIDTMGTEEWHRRRKGVVDYFLSLEKVELTEAEVQTPAIDRLYCPIAVYNDWMAWYMYLVESVLERPGVDEPFQSARVYPFFAAIGRHLEALKKVKGIDERLQTMLNEGQNQPDSTLFELAVLVLYLKNGWSVVCLEEARSGKTPDFEAKKNGQTFWVECKRLAKVPEFADQERAIYKDIGAAQRPLLDTCACSV